ncbi:glycosyltransferase family 2 protein [Pseudanabaena sp. UWO311]|uniref:glycosyltransferase family A protein n=1 Tax=Pseudanabaena sp. UWO311 TaxID=2487337 RepID=UPI00115B8302|nr:glycosyltransferase family A protein [Pseudanabaena sp. UWO311]TYQ26949.1 glycosyltransferase family 2 protein [Pseudanabaena sp. UWO311]
MIVFIVPLKSALTSSNWHLVSQLFERSIKSICNQTSSDFKAIVVCHELPDITFQHPNVDYIQVDFPMPNSDSDLYIKETDRSLKVWYGLNYAKKYQPSHVMIVDADDLINCNIADFVSKHTESNGWYVEKGYEYREGSNSIYLMRSKFQDKCGTCNIVRYNLLDKYINFDISDVKGFQFLHHQSVLHLMNNNSTPLEKLPFEGAIYVIGHTENMWLPAFKINMLKQSKFKELFLFRLRQIVKTLLSQKLTETIRQTFGLYDL